MALGRAWVRLVPGLETHNPGWSCKEMSATSPAEAPRGRCPLGIPAPFCTCRHLVSLPAVAVQISPGSASLEQWRRRRAWSRVRRYLRSP